jgi:hypothetical protein
VSDHGVQYLQVLCFHQHVWLAPRSREALAERV